MEHVIADLVGRFERGRLSRRELIQALAVVAAAGAGTPASAAPLRSGSINHVSVLVTDMKPTPPSSIKPSSRQASPAPNAGNTSTCRSIEPKLPW